MPSIYCYEILFLNVCNFAKFKHSDWFLSVCLRLNHLGSFSWNGSAISENDVRGNCVVLLDCYSHLRDKLKHLNIEFSTTFIPWFMSSTFFISPPPFFFFLISLLCRSFVNILLYLNLLDNSKDTWKSKENANFLVWFLKCQFGVNDPSVEINRSYWLPSV